MLLVLYASDGKVHSITQDGTLSGDQILVGGRAVADGVSPKLLAGYVPDQPTAHLYKRDGEAVTFVGRWPDALIQFTAEERAVRIDAETDKTIGAALHPFAPRGEEVAIHREQLQAILDSLGMKPTAKFARLTDIVLKSVVAGKDMKATKVG